MERNRDRNSWIAEKIISKATMARGVVVLDHDLLELASALRDANILVVELRPDASDELKERLLSHRIMVTKNPTAFIDDAPVHEYGVIALDNLDIIDPDPTYRKNKTVRLLSKAMSQYGLWVKGAKFLLELRADGEHVLKELI